MFVLGHTGLGSAMVGRWVRGGGLYAVLLGTLLPDLIDKPLYYGLVLATGRRGAELGLITGSRTVGHTGLLLALVGTWAAVMGAWGKREGSRRLGFLALGMATHLGLDLAGELGGLVVWALGDDAEASRGTLCAVLFPLCDGRFPVMPFADWGEHARSLGRPYVVLGEILGAMVWTRRWLRVRMGEGGLRAHSKTAGTRKTRHGVASMKWDR